MVVDNATTAIETASKHVLARFDGTFTVAEAFHSVHNFRQYATTINEWVIHFDIIANDPDDNAPFRVIVTVDPNTGVAAFVDTF